MVHLFCRTREGRGPSVLSALRVNIRKGIKGMKMKKYIGFVLLIGLLLSLTSCSTKAGDGTVEPTTSQLSLYIPYSYTPKYEEALELFEQRYPDVEVTITKGNRNTVRKNNAPAHLRWSAIANAKEITIMSGTLQRMNLKVFPAAKRNAALLMTFS